MKDFIEEKERWDLEPRPVSLWWRSTCADEKKDDIKIMTRTGVHKLPFEKKFKILGYTFNQARRTQDNLEKRMQSANKAWWQRCEDLQKQRRTVESEMQENGGASLRCVLLRERKLVLE